MDESVGREKHRQLPAALWWTSGVVGLITGLGSLLLIPLPWLWPILRQEGMGVLLTGYGLLGAVLGIGLLAAAVRGIRRRPLGAFNPGRLWIVLAGTSLLLVMVASLLPFETAGFGFVVLHAALIALPALALLSLLTLWVGPKVKIYLRHLMLMIAGGALSTALALPLEMIGLAFGGALVVGGAFLFPGGEAEVNRLMSLLMRWSANPPTNPEELLTLISSPVVLVLMIVTLAVVAPLVEELLKAVLVGVAGFWVRPGVAETFLWGAACGVGFAVIEGVANGAIGLENTWGWLGGLGTRLLATAMHALTSGVLALGWRGLWTGRWWRLPLAFAGVVIYHGLWNFNVVLALGGAGLTEQTPGLGGGLLVLGGVLAVTMMIVTVVGIVALPLWLRRRTSSGGA